MLSFQIGVKRRSLSGSQTLEMPKSTWRFFTMASTASELSSNRLTCRPASWPMKRVRISGSRRLATDGTEAMRRCPDLFCATRFISRITRS